MSIAEVETDWCPVCEMEREYDSAEQCTTCGRGWGLDYSLADIVERKRHEHAERIAREILALNLANPEDAQKSDDALRHLTYSGDRVREILTAAALQALTETENAR